MVRGFYPEESPGTSEIDEIDGHAETCFQTAPRIEERDRIHGLFEEHADIDVAVATGLVPRAAAVQPRPQQTAFRKSQGQLVKQRVGEVGDRDHPCQHTRRARTA